MDHYSRSARNCFADDTVDRVTLRRNDEQWLSQQISAPATRFVPVWQSRNLIGALDGDARGRAVTLTHEQVRALNTDLARFRASDSGHTDSVVSSAGGWAVDDCIFLGYLDNSAWFAVECRQDFEHSDLERWNLGEAAFTDLRNHGSVLPAPEAALLAHARAMTYWHQRHRFCGSCGQPTVARAAGHERQCVSADCGVRQFPRTDPAIIVLVVTPTADGQHQRCLLGRSAHFAPQVYSTLAGFVEPGESIEAAVRRECMEEAGVRVDAVDYESSQPWPFPSSLMLGFRAHAQYQPVVLQDQELEDARWFTRAEIRAEVIRGALRLPRATSIAFRLFEDWYDEGEQGALAEFWPQEPPGPKAPRWR